MGEAIHLSHAERVVLIRAARKALDVAGLPQMPIISGTGAGSTRETIELCKQAAEAGSDYAIVIASGYFSTALAGKKEALKAFWADVSQNSPIPVIVYNCEIPTSGPTLTTHSSKTLAQVVVLISTRTSLSNLRPIAPTSVESS